MGCRDWAMPGLDSRWVAMGMAVADVDSVIDETETVGSVDSLDYTTAVLEMDTEVVTDTAAFGCCSDLVQVDTDDTEIVVVADDFIRDLWD